MKKTAVILFAAAALAGCKGKNGAGDVQQDNRVLTKTEMLSIIRDIMDAENLAEYRFDVSDMVNMLEIRGIRVDHPTVRRILAENWQLRPAPPTYYQRYTITYNGETQRQDSKTARVYTVTREQLGGLLDDAAM